MDVPDRVQAALDGEEVAARVVLKGEDALFVTPTRTLHYRAEGLLSDETVEEYPHEAERIEVSEGRRKAAIALDYGLEGDRELSVPAGDLDRALHVVLAGVLRANGVTDTDESVLKTYRFSELTIVVTSARVVKQIGEVVWDRDDYEEVHFDDVTAMRVEEGSVASQIVLETGERPKRIKTPSESLREVRETVERALFDYHDVTSHDELERVTGAETEGDVDEADAAEEVETITFGDESVEEVSALTDADASEPAESATEEPTEPAETESGATESAEGESETAAEVDEADKADEAELDIEALRREVEALHETVERQRDALEEQEAAIETLAEQLSRDQ